MNEHVFTHEQIKQLIVDQTTWPPDKVDLFSEDHLEALSRHIDLYADTGLDYGTSFLRAWQEMVAYYATKRQV